MTELNIEELKTRLDDRKFLLNEMHNKIMVLTQSYRDMQSEIQQLTKLISSTDG